MVAKAKDGRRVLGFVRGQQGVLGSDPFFVIHLPKEAAVALDQLLGSSDGSRRCTVTITITSHQPNRLRITEIDPPQYESKACETYLRGDTMRVNGGIGKTCGLDLSARFGVPAIRSQLREALDQADEFIVLRVPSRKHDLIEFIPDTAISTVSNDAMLQASMSSAAQLLPAEEFTDWEKD